MDGREYKLSLSRQKKEHPSQPHLQTRQLLTELFPCTIFYEETYIKSEQLYLDFFSPILNLVVEVHGEQHYTFNKHFYKSHVEFAMAQNRDRIKKEWCVKNGFTLLELKHDDRGNWRTQIISFRDGKTSSSTAD